MLCLPLHKPSITDKTLNITKSMTSHQTTQPGRSFLEIMSSSWAELDTPTFLKLAAAELAQQQARIYDQFEIMVTTSNSITATYHTLVQMHGDCERTIKESAAQGPSNGFITNVQHVQHVQARKAEIEGAMLEVENVQWKYWTEIRELQIASKCTAFKSCQAVLLRRSPDMHVAYVKQVVERHQESENQGSKRKADEMEENPGSGSGQVE